MDDLLWLHMEDHKRKTGKNKRKETFNKYGKNTARGLRHKLAAEENARANQPPKQNNKRNASRHG